MRFIARWIYLNPAGRFDERFIGRMASIHAAHYPCGMCGNRRRWEGKDSLAERRHAEAHDF